MTLFHVAIGHKGIPTPQKKIQDAFGPAGWARYAPNCWLVTSSTETAKTLTDKIRKVCKTGDTIFVIEVQPKNYYGYLHKQTWEWFHKHK